MPARRQRQRQLVSHGDSPDVGTGLWPDGPLAGWAVNSGMSAISESIHHLTARCETNWDEVFVVATRSSSAVASPRWRPAVNAYRCADQFVIFVDLAGVPADSVKVQAEANRVIISGRRPAAEPGCRRSELAQLLALEIDQGAFERVLDLPQEVDPAGMTTDCHDGLLHIRLPLLS